MNADNADGKGNAYELLVATADTIATMEAPSDVAARLELKALGLQSTTGAQPTRSRRHLVWGWSIVGCAAVALFACSLFVVQPPSIGWAQVTQAIESKEWIRGKVTFENGDRGAIWVNSKRQIWGFQSSKWAFWCDGKARVKYEWRPRKSVEKWALNANEDSTEKILPLGALAENAHTVGVQFFGTERIVAQSRRTVVEEGREWIEFELQLGRGDADYNVLRVDPRTRLPVSLQGFVRTKGEGENHVTDRKSIRWEFDYPDSGPEDIFALGVPADTPIIDREPTERIRDVLDGMAKTRQKLRDFRLVVVARNSQWQNVSIVTRKGDRWRIDRSERILAGDEPADADVNTIVEKADLSPRYLCDGSTVWYRAPPDRGKPMWERASRVTPTDLTMCEPHSTISGAHGVNLISRLYPDLTPIPGWGFEVDFTSNEPPGLVIIKRSANLASKEPKTGHEWYYVDPEKGYAVVRVELFNVPGHSLKTTVQEREKAAGQRVFMEDFQKTEAEFWYCETVRETRFGPNDTNFIGEETVRFRMSTKVDVPEGFFEIKRPRVGF